MKKSLLKRLFARKSKPLPPHTGNLSVLIIGESDEVGEQLGVTEDRGNEILSLINKAMALPESKAKPTGFSLCHVLVQLNNELKHPNELAFASIHLGYKLGKMHSNPLAMFMGGPQNG